MITAYADEHTMVKYAILSLCIINLSQMSLNYMIVCRDNETKPIVRCGKNNLPQNVNELPYSMIRYRKDLSVIIVKVNDTIPSDSLLHYHE